MTLLPRVDPIDPKQTARVAVLDVGSSKIACAVIELVPVKAAARTHDARIMALASRRAAGVKGGVVVDAAATASVIRLVVDAAEKQARVTVDAVIVGTNAGRLKSKRYSADVSLTADYVRDSDVARAFAAAADVATGDERVTLHALPCGFTLDGQSGIREPVGMRGGSLGADLHIVTAEAVPILNLMECVESCQLDVEGFVAAPYASGLAALTDDEIEQACTLIDLGGGTSTAAVFHKGELVHLDALAVGGDHVTRDIGRTLRLSMTDAERVKVLQGNAFAAQIHDAQLEELFDVAELSAEDRLGDAVRSRVEETLDLLRARLDAAPVDVFSGRVVLTGGASQLAGVGELAQSVLGLPVRLGAPRVDALSGAATPAAAALVGLGLYAATASKERYGDAHLPSMSGYWSRFGQWIKESF